MSALSVRLPESLHRHLKEAAKADGVSVNQFISLAVAEKISALQTYDLIAKRGERSSREAFLEAMAAVPATKVAEEDEVPKGYRTKKKS